MNPEKAPNADIFNLQDLKKNEIEQAAWKQNKVIIGLDEAGRGPLFGNVSIGGAILKISENQDLEHLKDSKKMSAKAKVLAFKWIKENTNFVVIYSPSSFIDRFGISEAVKFAMKKAIYTLKNTTKKRICGAAIDFVKLDLAKTHSYSMTQGEDKSSSIAAASIAAKVLRDETTTRIANAFPTFELQKHKGYGTKAHKEAIFKNKLSVLHRSSFCGFTKND